MCKFRCFVTIRAEIISLLCIKLLTLEVLPDEFSSVMFLIV